MTLTIVLISLFANAFAADCDSVNRKLGDLESGRPNVELDYDSETDYDLGLKKSAKLEEAYIEFEELPQDAKCRSDLYAKIMLETLALSPFDQEGSMSDRVGATTLKNPALKSIYGKTLVKFAESKTNLPHWCRAQALQTSVDAYWCEKKPHGGRKCRPVTFNFEACVHAVDKAK